MKIKPLLIYIYIKRLFQRIFRFSIPFLIIFILEIIFGVLDLKKHSLFTYFVNGGVGQGSYYFPVLVQLMFLFCIMFFFFKKDANKTLISIFFINLFYEFLCSILDIKDNTYRILSFRYLFLFSLGIWLSMCSKKIKKKYLIISFVIGFLYILNCAYLKIDIFLFKKWANTSMMCAFYIFPIFYFLYDKFSSFKLNNIFYFVLTEIGKASWHIFLLQMLFYAKFKLLFSFMPLAFWHLSNVFLCIIVGWLFYFIENKIFKLKLSKT